MIERTYSADIINYLVNHPSVRPFVGGDINEPQDLGAPIADEQNYFLIGEHGGFALIWSAPRVYEVHTFILPEGRGKWARDAVKAMLAYMTEYSSFIWTHVHPDAANVRIFTLRAGFKPSGSHRLDLGAGPVDYLTYIWRVPCQ